MHIVPGQCDSPRERQGSLIAIAYSTAVDVASDLMIMSLPLALIPSLQLDRKKKVGLVVVFSLGFIIIAFAVIRMTQVIHHTNVDLVGLAIWSSVESSVAVIVGCMPPLKGFLTKSMRAYTAKRSAHGYNAASKGFNSRDQATYAGAGQSKSAVITESIPLDETNRSRHEQDQGQIFVSTSYGWHHDTRSVADDSSAKEYDDTSGIVKRSPEDVEAQRLKGIEAIGHAR
jgi:hypothetical protein